MGKGASTEQVVREIPSEAAPGDGPGRTRSGPLEPQSCGASLGEVPASTSRGPEEPACSRICRCPTRPRTRPRTSRGSQLIAATISSGAV
jgi:hypothetical protein